jgi:branched-chain amino acid aminotransferase
MNGWKSSMKDRRIEKMPMTATGNVNQICLNLPKGVYTTLRTYHGEMIFRFSKHVERLIESARLTGCKVPVSAEAITEILRIAINEHQNLNLNLKLRVHVDTTIQPGDIYLFTESLSEPSRVERTTGVRVNTRIMHRENPLAKSTAFIVEAEALRSTMTSDVNEIILVSDDGGILEGLSSNVFIIRDEKIITAGEGILAGITRSVVLDALIHLNIPINFESYPISELTRSNECFITSTSRGVLAVRSIDDISFPSPVPGKMTRAIASCVESIIETELEKI